MPASSPARKLAATRRPTRSKRHHPLRIRRRAARRSPTFAGIPARRARTWATKPISPSCAAARIRSSVRPPLSSSKSDQRRGQRLDAARAVIALAEHALGGCGQLGIGAGSAARAARSRASAGGDRAGPALRRVARGRSSKASRHWPKRSRRRPRARISAIAAAATAPSSMADQALEDARLAAAAARLGGGRDPLFVGAAQQQRASGPARSSRPRRGQRRRSAPDCPRRSRPRPAARQRGANRIGDIADQAMKHRGHQRPLLLGQALGGIEEKIDADGGQPVAARGARGRVLVGCRAQQSAILPASSAPALSDFALTSRQLGG